jgi:hypothetical protein
VTQTCRVCREDKPLTRFPLSKGKRENRCADCKASQRRVLSEAEVVALRRSVGLPDDGPTEEDRERWKPLEMQGGTA